MAIVEMKRLTLLALLREKEKLLHAISRMGCIQITDIPEDGMQPFLAKASGLLKTEEEVGRLRWAIGKLSRYDKTKPPMFGGKPEVSREQAEEILARKAYCMQIVAAMEGCEQKSGEYKGSEARLQSAIELLEPWAAFDIPISLLHDTHDTLQQAGTIKRRALVEIAAKWDGQPVVLTQVSAYQETVYLHVIVHHSVAEAVLSDLKDAGFTQAVFGDVHDTPGRQIEDWKKELSAIADGQRNLEEQLAAMAKEMPSLKILYDVLCAQQDRLRASERFASTQSTFLMKAWVPEPLVKKVEEKILQVSPGCCMEFADPVEGDEPPTLLQNHRSVAPFETVVAGFSLPSPFGIDPTFVMAPFFATFFGMMVSDAGYGLMMVIAIPLILKLAKPSPGAKKLLLILALGGVTTVFWGAMFNSWFGFSPLPLYFDPVNNALPVMGLCMGIGALHLFAGLGMGFYLNVRRGSLKDALFSQGSWFCLIVGLGLLALPATATVGKFIALAGAVTILLTAGRGKSKNPLKRLLSGLGALYGVTGWISDLLSYMRLFGMGVATGVIGMVINQLVGMVFSAGPIGMVLGAALFCGGHLFNAGINILGAYVHSCRLQYIEFFGKFYEEGGKPFNPLGETTRYVRISDASQAR
jgi:V/A-type H+-transporting ATPase subunit I